MRVVTPSSSYTFPEAPKPEILLACGALRPNSFRALSNDPAVTPREPKKVRRFHLSCIVYSLNSLFSCNRCDAIDFHKRVSRQRRDGHCRSRRTTMGEIGFKYLIHAIVEIDIRQIHGELQNAIDRASARFDQSLDAFHYSARMVFDVLGEGLTGVVRVRSLTSNVDQAVVDDERRDHLCSLGGLAFITKLLNAARRLCSSGLFVAGSCRAEDSSKTQSRKETSDACSEISSSEEFADHSISSF